MKTAIAVLVGVLLGAAVVALIPRNNAAAQDAQPVARDHRDKAWIGFSYAADQFGGLAITRVENGSPAWDAGLMIGDTIVGTEVIQDGKRVAEMKHGQTVPFFLAGLDTSAPGTEFTVYVKRGEQSLNAEKTFAVDFPREKIDVPICSVIIQHVREKSKEWKQAEFVWMTFKSRSWNEWADYSMRVQKADTLRLEAMKLQKEVRDADLKRLKLLVDIQNAIAQKNLALAQVKTAEAQEVESGFSIFSVLLGLLTGL